MIAQDAVEFCAAENTGAQGLGQLGERSSGFGCGGSSVDAGDVEAFVDRVDLLQREAQGAESGVSPAESVGCFGLGEVEALLAGFDRQQNGLIVVEALAQCAEADALGFELGGKPEAVGDESTHAVSRKNSDDTGEGTGEPCADSVVFRWAASSFWLEATALLMLASTRARSV